MMMESGDDDSCLGGWCGGIDNTVLSGSASIRLGVDKPFFRAPSEGRSAGLD